MSGRPTNIRTFRGAGVGALLLLAVYPSGVPARAQRASGPPAAQVDRQADGVTVPVGSGFLKVTFCTEDVVRVAFARDAAFFDRKSLAAGERRCQAPQWRIGGGSRGSTVDLESARLTVRVDRATGAVSFLDRAAGMLQDRTFQVVLASKAKPAGFSFTPAPDRTVRYTGSAVDVMMR